MSDIFSGLGKVANVLDNIYNDKQGVDALELPIDIASSGKITKVLSKFIVTPNVVVDESLQYLDPTVFRNIVKTEMMVFTSVVTNAIRAMVEVYGVSPLVAINSINQPTSSDTLHKIVDIVDGMEGRDFIGEVINGNIVLGGLESAALGDIKHMGDSNITPNTFKEKDSSSFVNTYDIQIQLENVNGQSRVVTLPIIVYPKIIFEKTSMLIKRRLGKNNTVTFRDELTDANAGIQSFLDIILATNIVKDYAERKLKKPSEFARYLDNLDNVGNVKSIIHNTNHFSKNFNIYIMGKDLLPVINKTVAGSIYRDKYKEKLLDALMGFSLTIVDNDAEQIEYFLSNIEGMSVLNYEMLSKEKDGDMNKMLKELMMQKAPF